MKKFNSLGLKQEIYEIEELSFLGGLEKELYLPVIAEVDREIYVVFFVMTRSDKMPGAFIICKDGVHPEYFDYDQGLKKLDIIEADIERDYDILDEEEEEESAIPDDIYDRFDAAYNGETVDRRAYAAYMDAVISGSNLYLRRYLRLFL